MESWRFPLRDDWAKPSIRHEIRHGRRVGVCGTAGSFDHPSFSGLARCPAGATMPDLISLQRGTAGASLFNDRQRRQISNRRVGFRLGHNSHGISSSTGQEATRLGSDECTMGPTSDVLQTSKCSTALTKTHCSRSRRRLAMSSKKPKNTSQNPPFLGLSSSRKLARPGSFWVPDVFSVLHHPFPTLALITPLDARPLTAHR